MSEGECFDEARKSTVFGAGAQRSDPKVGNPDDYPFGLGPQGDVVRIFNYTRAVRDAPESAVAAPAVSQWGLVAMVLLLMVVATMTFRQRRIGKTGLVTK